VADYRAKNRNTKAVDVARVRAAAKFSTPAPKVNPNIVPQKPKVSAEYSAALREQAQRGVAGARGGSYFDRSQYGPEAIFDPVTGISGAAKLATTDYNPEGIKYPTRMVPAGARGGGMVSGGQPNIGSSFAGILEAVKGMATPPPTTEFDAAMQEKYKNNPRAVGAAQQRLSPEEKYQMTNKRENAKREDEYSKLLSTLKAAGLTEEELYRSAVVSPDGKINLNPNAEAIISQLGNAADSLRLLDVAGLGAGKVVGVGARAAGRTARRAVEDIAVRGFPIPVPVGVGGVPIMRVGGSKATKEAANVKPVRNTEPYSVVLSPEEVNRARSGSPIGIPMEASSESKGLATPEEYAQLSPDERAIEDSVRSISRQVWGKRRGLNEPPAKYQVQDYPTVEDVAEVITKGSKRYGKLSTKQIEALHKSIGEYIDATPGAKWRIGNRQGLDIHHTNPYASGGVGDPAKLAPLQSTINRFIGKKPMSIWYREQVNSGVINVWKDIAPELIASIEAAL
jgi:hypothetical protein